METAHMPERFILLSAAATDPDGSDPLDELAQLADTAGADVVGRVTQRREAAHPGHYLGKGKIDELRDLIAETNAEAVVADDELTAAQQRNLHEKLGIKVLDRSGLILDIFAARALSSEGRAQVELAQLKYNLSHLTGQGVAMSRLAGGGGIRGGGIGTRGPGEKKLETDRRHIRRRIDQLSKELEGIRASRAVLRNQREKNQIPIISIVGYTNAGKSTLMNALTQSGVLAEDKLFATLDTTTRRLALPGSEALLTDTVGFIRKLPHHLIQAFRATLEELEYADILLQVVDASDPAREDHMAVTYDLLKSLGLSDKKVITAFNKTDAIDPSHVGGLVDSRAAASVAISAKNGQNLPALLEILEDKLREEKRPIDLLIPYAEGRWVSWIHERCEVTASEHTGAGVRIRAWADAGTAGMVAPFVVKTLN